jgi:hypothetical protein
MITLAQADEAAITQYGRELMETYRSEFASFEQAAQAVSQRFYEEFVREDGKPLFALVRIYRLTKFDELNDEIKPLVDSARERWMTLMGTYGIEAAWCDRHQSQGHKALNLGSDQSPMVSASIYQLGMDVGVEMPAAPLDLTVPEVSLMTRYFHIEKALGSPYIPAQDGFVKPYGIKSVVGLGSNFVGKGAYLLLGFATAPISAASAQAFSQMAPFIATLMALYDKKVVWA